MPDIHALVIKIGLTAAKNIIHPLLFCVLQFSRFNSGWIILICILLFGNSSLYTKYLAPMLSHSFKIAAIFVTMPDTHAHNINIGLPVTKSIIYQLLFCALQFSQCSNSDWIILKYFLLFENYSYYILLLHFYFLFENYIVFFYNNILRRHEVYQCEEWKKFIKLQSIQRKCFICDTFVLWRHLNKKVK